MEINHPISDSWVENLDSIKIIDDTQINDLLLINDSIESIENDHQRQSLLSIDTFHMVDVEQTLVTTNDLDYLEVSQLVHDEDDSSIKSIDNKSSLIYLYGNSVWTWPTNNIRSTLKMPKEENEVQSTNLFYGRSIWIQSSIEFKSSGDDEPINSSLTSLPEDQHAVQTLVIEDCSDNRLNSNTNPQTEQSIVKQIFEDVQSLPTITLEEFHSDHHIQTSSPNQIVKPIETDVSIQTEKSIEYFEELWPLGKTKCPLEKSLISGQSLSCTDSDEKQTKISENSPSIETFEQTKFTLLNDDHDQFETKDHVVIQIGIPHVENESDTILAKDSSEFARKRQRTIRILLFISITCCLIISIIIAIAVPLSIKSTGSSTTTPVSGLAMIGNQGSTTTLTTATSTTETTITTTSTSSTTSTTTSSTSETTITTTTTDTTSTTSITTTTETTTTESTTTSETSSTTTTTTTSTDTSSTTDTTITTTETTSTKTTSTTSETSTTTWETTTTTTETTSTSETTTTTSDTTTTTTETTSTSETTTTTSDSTTTTTETTTTSETTTTTSDTTTITTTQTTSTTESTASTSESTSSTTETTTTSTTTAIPCTDMRWNTTGVTVAGTGVAGSAVNQLYQPWNLHVDSNQNLYVADAANHRIQYWPTGANNGITIAGISGLWGSGSNQLDMPSDIFVDRNGNFYVADRNNNRIQYFRNGTTNGITVSSGWGGTGGFRGVQVASNGLIYASDTSNNALWRNNTVPFGYQGAGGAPIQLNGNQGITLDTTVNFGYLYIANANQHTIVQWIPGTNYGNVVAGQNGVMGNNNSTMAYPVAVRIDSLGNLFVVDNNNHRIQLYCRFPTVSSTARTIIGTGSPGSTSTTLKYPSGLALDNDLNIYVADNDNHRIQKFTRIT